MSTYTLCMKPYMSGGGPDRKLRFCIGAKICSGKAADEETAKQICLSQPPKEQSTGTGAGKRQPKQCAENMAKLAACVISKIDWDAITQETFEEHLTQALRECSCRPKKAKAALTPTVRVFRNPSYPEVQGAARELEGYPEVQRAAKDQKQHWSRA